MLGWSDAGILLEIIGAGFLVWKSLEAKQSLKGFPAPLTFNNFIPALERLVLIVGGQFRDQLKGFAILGLGLALQLYGNLQAS